VKADTKMTDLPPVEVAVLDAGDPMSSARTLVDRHYMLDGQRTLQRYRGEFWQWQTTHYRSVDEEMIRSTRPSVTTRAVSSWPSSPASR
jgi:hypothetical protein